MNYPLISEYIESIKSAEDNFEELSYLRPVLDNTGQPVMSSGNFAVVFKMKDERAGKLYAVRCFHRDQEGREDSYRLIEEELKDVESPYLVSFRYIDKELFVDSSQTNETEFPVLLMNWVEGITLDKYLRENLYDQYALEMLAYRFSQLAQWLIPQPFAHGDLKPDNILVREDGTLVLVDYDGMYVPAMKGHKARELGSPDFRHPLRTEDDFDEHIDDFPFVSILLSLKAIALKPSFLNDYGASDRLLFSGNNYRNISECNLLKKLFPSDDSELNVLTSLFMIALEKNSRSAVSFRLFDLCKPKEPVYMNLGTEVTKEDLANARTDEFCVKYSKDRKRLLKYNKYSIKGYTIKPGTIVICNNAFSLLFELDNGACFDYCPLSKIHIPDSVTHIGDGAFSSCSKLKEINIPKSVKHIGNCAFQDCVSLLEVHIPDSVSYIGVGAFMNCSSVLSISVNQKNKYYDSRYNCNAIIETKNNCLIVGCQSTIIPDSVTHIGDRAFAVCQSLFEVHIPDSVTSIGNEAFTGCSSLSVIHIPNTVTHLGDKAFANCWKLKEVHIPNSVSYIGDKVFYGCRSLSVIHIPDSVTKIGDEVFADCESLSKIIIPNSITHIGDGAFGGCISLSEIHIPASITYIGKDAFDCCDSLSQIIVPLGVWRTIENMLPEALKSKVIER